MATNIGNLQIRIGADVRELVDATNKSLSQIEKVKQAVNFSAVVQGFNLLKNAFTSVAGIASDLIAEFDADAKAAQKLTVALHGNVGAAKELLTQASQLQKTRLFPDEVTANADAILASMGFQKEAITSLIPLIQDFASAYGIDLAEAAQKVGKQITTGGDALKRYGINVEDASSVAGRFTNVMDALTKSVQGQSEAAAKAGAGPLELLKQQFGEIKEKIGEGIVAFIGVFLPKANEGVAALSSSLNEIPKTFENIAKQLLPVLTILKGIIQAVQIGRSIVDFVGLGSPTKTQTKNRSNVLDDPFTQSQIASRKAKEDALELAANFKKLQAEFDKANKAASSKEGGGGLSTWLIDIKRAAESKPLAQLAPDLDLVTDQFNKLSEAAERARRAVDLKALGGSFVVAPLGQPERNINGKVNKSTLKTSDEELKKATKLEEEFNAAKAAALDFSSQASAAINGALTDAFVSVGQAIGQAFSGENLNFNSLLGVFASLLEQVGAIAIQLGVAMLAIKLSLVHFNPVLAIAAGIALTALGALIKGRLAKTASPTHLAEGGITNGPTFALVGDNPGGREVVSPLTDLLPMIQRSVLEALQGLRAPSIGSFIRQDDIRPALQAINIEPQPIEINGRFELSGTDLIASVARNGSIRSRNIPRSL